MADTPRETVVVDRRGSGAGVLIGVAALILVAIAGYFVIAHNNNEARETDAISRAADDIGDSAQKIGDAAQDAANKQ